MPRPPPPQTSGLDSLLLLARGPLTCRGVLGCHDWTSCHLAGGGQGGGQTPRDTPWRPGRPPPQEDPAPLSEVTHLPPRPRKHKQAPRWGFTNFISRLFTFVLFPAGNVPVTCLCWETPWCVTINTHRPPSARPPGPPRPRPLTSPGTDCLCPQTCPRLWPQSTHVPPPPATGRPSSSDPIWFRQRCRSQEG